MGVRGRGHHHQRDDAGEQEAAAEQHRVVAPVLEQVHLPEQQREQHHAHGRDDVESSSLVAQWPAQDGHRPPQHREAGTEQQPTRSRDAAEVQRVVGADAPTEHVPVAVAVLVAARQRHEAVGEQHTDQHGDGDADADELHAHLRQAASRAAQHGDHHQRPQQIELLLDRQRPQVAQRDERLGRGVALADEDLVPVADVQQTGHEVATRALAHGRVEGRDVQHQRGHHHVQRRQQASAAAQPELAQVHTAVALVLTDDQQRDQVAGDDEEHLHTEEPAPQPRVVGVVDHHRDHRDGAQAVEARQVRDSAQAARGGGGPIRHSGHQYGR